MVEAYSDVATPATEGDEATLVVGEVFERLLVHLLLSVSVFVLGELVGELPNGRHVLEDSSDVRGSVGIDLWLREHRYGRDGGRLGSLILLTGDEGDRA